jgi:hypothetical protein
MEPMLVSSRETKEIHIKGKDQRERTSETKEQGRSLRGSTGYREGKR